MSGFTVSRATLTSRIAGVLALALLLGLAAAPWWAFLHLAGEFAVYLALATLWNLLAGYTGPVSVGQQAQVVGGYATFTLALFFGVPPLLAVPMAGLVAARVAVPVASLVFRLQGAHFAIGSWVIADRLIAAQATALGGGSGISLPAAVTRLLGGKMRLDGTATLRTGPMTPSPISSKKSASRRAYRVVLFPPTGDQEGAR